MPQAATATMPAQQRSEAPPWLCHNEADSAEDRLESNKRNVSYANLPVDHGVDRCGRPFGPSGPTNGRRVHGIVPIRAVMPYFPRSRDEAHLIASGISEQTWPYVMGRFSVIYGA
jgi:hypothetical protein